MENRKEKEIIQDYMNDIKIPSNLDNVIKASIDRARKGDGNMNVKQGKHWIKTLSYCVASFVAVILIFTITVNTNEAFASTLSEIPILKDIVNIFMIKKDDNLKDAIDQNFIQNENIENETLYKKEDIEYEIKSVILEESRIVVAFSLNGIELGDKDNKNYTLKIDVYNEEKDWMGYMLISEPVDENGLGLAQLSISEVWYKAEDKFNISDNVIIKTEINEFTYKNGREHTAEMETIYEAETRIAVDKRKFNKEPITYNLNKTITVEDTKINLKKLELRPTTTILTYDVEEGENKRFLGIGDLILTDGKSINEKSLDTRWELEYKYSKYSEHLPNKEMQRDGVVFFQSIYYKEFENLYLQGGGVCIPTWEESRVVIDMNKDPIAQNRFYNFYKVGENKIKVTNKAGTEPDGGFEVEAILLSDIEKGKINYYDWMPENLAPELTKEKFEIRIREFPETDKLKLNVKIK